MHSISYQDVQAIKRLFAAGKDTDALRAIAAEVEKVHLSSTHASMRQENMLGDIRLDDLLLTYGKTLAAKAPWQPDPNSVVILATNVFTFGGHSLWIEQLVVSGVAAGKKVDVVLTDELGKAGHEDSLCPRLMARGARVTILPGATNRALAREKVLAGLEVLARIRPTACYLFNHHNDPICIALGGAIRHTSNVIFVHHADHALCLGAATREFIHCDGYADHLSYCKRVFDHDNLYLPVALNDREETGRPAPFLSRTASCGSFNKFTADYRYSYANVVSILISRLNIEHHHIGQLPDALVKDIRLRIRELGGNPEAFVYIDKVASLWDYLVRARIDLYLGPFPIGGGRSMIEAMGAGIPCLTHFSLDSRVITEINLIAPKMQVWETPEQLLDILRNADKDWLLEQSGISRQHFLNYYDARLLDAFFTAPEQGLPRLDPPPLRMDVHEQKDLGSEMQYLQWLRNQWLSTSGKQRWLEWLSCRPPVVLNFIIDASGADASDLELAVRTIQSANSQRPAVRLHVVSPSASMLTSTEGFKALAEFVATNNSGDLPTSLMALAEAEPQSWLCVLRPGDLLDNDALIRISACLQAQPETMLLYADEDTLDVDNTPYAPQLKPDFDITLLRCTPYMGRFLLMHATAYRSTGGLDASFGSAAFQDYAFRCAEQFGQSAISHLPGVLFHARPADTPPELDACAKAVSAHFARRKVSVQLSQGLLEGSLRVQYLHTHTPLVSIIIPTKNQFGMLSRCIESLTGRSSYANYEILLVDNQSDEAEAVNYLQGIREMQHPNLRVLSYDAPFNFSAMNNLAAREAKGEYLILLNNDTAIIKGDWIEALLNHAMQQEVGIVGAKLLYPDGHIQHAGVVLGLRGPAEHPFLNETMTATGYGGRLQVDQQYSAVTAACLMIRKRVYEEVEGLDERDFKVSYNDVDLCLKVREAGYAVVWTPHSLVMHAGSVTQRAEAPAQRDQRMVRFESERQAMYRKWLPRIAHDPFYNPNFSLTGSGFRLEANTAFIAPLPNQPRLIAHCADIHGSGLYRVISPADALIKSALAAGGCCGDYLHVPDISRLKPRTIVLQRQLHDVQINHIQNYHRYSGAKLIYELDDFLPNLPVASIHKGVLPKDVLRRMRTAMDLCDRVTVSTEALKEAFSPYHADVLVLPNYLPEPMWGNIPIRPCPNLTRRPRVGWAGGSSHTGDLRIVADVIRALSDKVDWVFFGMKPEGLDSYVAEFHPGETLGHYPGRLASLDLDLAIAPLEENSFNECKSNLRLLEYGICGYPVIATDLAPYRCGFPVTLVRNRFRDWVSAIEDKLADREALFAEGLALQAFVRAGWMLEGENLLRWRDGWLLGESP